MEEPAVGEDDNDDDDEAHNDLIGTAVLHTGWVRGH